MLSSTQSFNNYLKFTYRHLKLTPYSMMNIELTVKVLSSKVMFHPALALFYDMINILKPSLAPFSLIDDSR